jgi:hypothetical protein
VYILTTLKTLQTEFEFSFKNYTGKPYTTFLEKVSIHQETNKIGFVFFFDLSTIFYEFYKIQPGHPRSEIWFLTNRSLDFAF